jgi:hypothetical protein
MPTWQADYFDKGRDQAPTRSVIIEAQYESDALDESSLFPSRSNPA